MAARFIALVLCVVLSGNVMTVVARCAVLGFAASEKVDGRIVSPPALIPFGKHVCWMVAIRPPSADADASAFPLRSPVCES